MNSLPFFTATSYQSPEKSFHNSFCEGIDDYFYLGGKKAYVIQGVSTDGQNQVVLSDAISNTFLKIVKVFSYFTIIIPLCMLIIKTSLRSAHTFKVIEPSDGLIITEETSEKVEELIEIILGGQKHSDIEWRLPRNYEFKLKQNPNLIFSVCRNQDDESAFKNMVKAKEICLAYHLDRLFVPNTKMIEVNSENELSHSIIVKEHIDYIANESAQESNHHKYSQELAEPLRQLAIFIAKTAFYGLKWHNIPIIHEKSQNQLDTGSIPMHAFQIGLVNLSLTPDDHYRDKSPVSGFLGLELDATFVRIEERYGYRGLIRCCQNEDQMNIVIEEALKNGVVMTEEAIKNAKEIRLCELNYDEKLDQFYKEHHIINGFEQIRVKLAPLMQILMQRVRKNYPNFNQGDLKLLVKHVVAEINKGIQNGNKDASIKGKRFLRLAHCLFDIDPNNLNEFESANSYYDYRSDLLKLILEVLIDYNYLYDLECESTTAFFIQA